jgi:hypothetical protein
VICEIARNLGDSQMEAVRTLETDLGALVVAFSCRTFEPEREERLRLTMESLGPVLVAEPAAVDQHQLEKIRAAEAELSMALVAVRA